MKIGLYLAYPPGTKMVGQGLGVHLLKLLNGLLSLDNSPTIYILTPSWLRRELTDFLKSSGMNCDRLTFLSPDGKPFALLLYDTFFQKKDVKAGRLGRILRRLRASLKSSVKQVKALTLQVFEFFIELRLTLWTFPLLLLGIVLAVPAAIIAAVVLGVLSLARTALVVAPKLRRRLEGKLSGSGVSAVFNILRNVKAARSNKWVRSVFHIIHRRDCELMADIANKSDVDVWYSPTAFWPEFGLINGPKVVCVPDLSPTDYPVAYSKKNPQAIDAIEKCIRTIAGNFRFVTYSNYVAQNELQLKRGISADRIRVIPHAPNDLSEHIDIVGTMDATYAKTKLANSLIEGYRNVHYQGNLYLKDFSFTDTRYIFFPTQVRPNKNLLNLLKAYQILLRKKFRYVKLFVTGDILSDPDLREFVMQNRLQHEMIPFRDVSDQLLAALYHRAELVVNTSLFEGGFPFTFSEGLSVGTPSVQADIPVTREFVGTELAEKMLFDPYSPENIADVVAYGLANRAELVEMQTRLMDKFQNPCWKKVAHAHMSLFEELAGGAR